MKVRRISQNQSKVGLTALISALIVIGCASIPFTHSSGQQGGRDEIRIEINSNGFTPAEVQHAPGTFAIAVENATLSGEYTLKLQADDGTVLNEIRVQKGSSAWTVNLQTGRYKITEASHSQWICTIVVQ